MQDYFKANKLPIKMFKMPQEARSNLSSCFFLARGKEMSVSEKPSCFSFSEEQVSALVVSTV